MPRYRVLLTAAASVHGYVYVNAPDRVQAKADALLQVGNVVWQYDGVDDLTVDAPSVEEELA